jgi:hypothetical protein
MDFSSCINTDKHSNPKDGENMLAAQQPREPTSLLVVPQSS